MKLLKLLISTTETQGRRKNDFCFVPDGELVIFPAVECTGEKLDGGCGCRRSMSGLISRRGTTTLKVVEQSITQEQFIEKVYRSMKDGGWVSQKREKDIRDFAKASTDDLVRAIKKFPAGTILERRGGRFQPRT